MDCPKCGSQLRKLEQHWSEEKTNTLLRHVICDQVGGCGHSFWYEKEYTSITRDLATKVVLTQTVVKRRGRVNASVLGVFEVTPCTCDGAEPDPDYLNSHKIIEPCEKCGNSKSIEVEA